MAIDITKFQSNVDYTTVLNNFEGPLDLLLYLVKSYEIEIKDIFVSQVTEQFILYIQNSQMNDIEKASEYLSIAATLLEIKSKSLLPKVEIYDDGPSVDDLQDLVIQRVEEYSLFKEASLKLKENETVNRFYKQPEDSAMQTRVVYKDFNKDGLIKAFFNMLSKVDLQKKVKDNQKEIPKDVFTVSDKIAFMRQTLLQRKECSFYELFTEYATKSEIITTFQATLELLKLQYITFEQNSVYDDITIILRQDRSEEFNNDEQFDEQFDEYN